MGGPYPNHMISTEHLGKDCVNQILENKDKIDSTKDAIELASEIKIAVVAFQNLPRNCLDGKINYCAAVDNKHDVKNDRHQLIGGSNVATMGTYFIDTNLLLMAGASADLIAPKDFASDKKVEELFSYPTISKVDKELEKGNIIGLQGDYGVLCVTWFFMRLHLFAVNALNVPAKHRAMHVGLSMMWFTTIRGIHLTPKRNIMMESVGNMFLGKLHCMSYYAKLTFILFK